MHETCRSIWLHSVSILCSNIAFLIAHLLFIRAGFVIASLYENDSKWDLAIEKYTALANDSPSHALQAHLAKCRLVVIRDIGDQKLQQESVTALADTLKNQQHEQDEVLIEAWELLGKLDERKSL